MDILQIIRILTLLTGIIYMVMQVVQHKWMWYVNIFTSAGALVMAVVNGVWGIAALQAYFLVMDVVGIVRWARLKEHSADKKALLIVRMDKKTMLLSLAIAVLGSALVAFALSFIPSETHPVLDGISMTLSGIAIWWLTRSHVEEWYAWIAADAFLIPVYVMASDWWMVALYSAYVVTSLVGSRYWLKHGTYVE